MEKTKSGRRVAALIGSAWVLGAFLSAGCLFNQEPKYAELPDPNAPVAGDSGGSAGYVAAPANSGAADVTPATTPVVAPAPPAEAKGGASSDATSLDRIRVGESLDIVYSDTPNAAQPAHEKVRDDGTITLMWDKTFQAAGKTAGELAREIRKAYVPDYFKQLTVSVTRPDIRRVIYIDGEVKAPQKQEYTGRTTLSQVIAACGGFTDFANKRNIELIRPNGKKEKFNYNKILGDPRLDPEVNPGDRILVHRTWL